MKDLDKQKIFTTSRTEDVNFSDKIDFSDLNKPFIKSCPSLSLIICKEGFIALICPSDSNTTDTPYIKIPNGVIYDDEKETVAVIRETFQETRLLVKDVKFLVKGPSFLDPLNCKENYGIAIVKVFDSNVQAELINQKVLWMEETHVFERIRAQLFNNEKFLEDLFMSADSLYALMAYLMSK